MESNNMQVNHILADHIEKVHFGENWCGINLQETLYDLRFEEAILKVEDCHSIASLTFHLNYYVAGLNEVFKGGELAIRDKFSFDHNINTQEDWQKICEKSFADAKEFCRLLRTMDESRMNTFFVDEKYGKYYGNILGIIEHCYYHLGQIVLLKKRMRKA